MFMFKGRPITKAETLLKSISKLTIAISLDFKLINKINRFINIRYISD